MKKTMIAVACAAGLLCLASCNDNAGSDNQATDTTGSATVAATDSTITDKNKELLAFAARNNMLQVELGKLAAAQGATDQVKAYGQDLVDWYTAKQEELQELAQQYGVTLPQQLEDEQTEHLNDLKEAKPEDFNKAYWDNVTDAQEEAIDELEDNLKDVDEASATTFSLWARNALKELRAQYEQAKANEVDLKNEDAGISESINQE
ncbi:DUF4142 domain-containing protein [Pontibacter mangrovi]|uniref:DUF4142 domain-containing protein n=1 Tax=Pontibacter mangrovi TaxID=2589816 RepID=A0A501W6C0_9BACT|nr:DUF4142 domain-containing protein [Pontibacter mangrovi]TPE43644.1 DUF4142 domain-containing protein [Pontibacter mangrovi]